jgi:hypothetical protein
VHDFVLLAKKSGIVSDSFHLDGIPENVDHSWDCPKHSIYDLPHFIKDVDEFLSLFDEVVVFSASTRLV